MTHNVESHVLMFSTAFSGICTPEFSASLLTHWVNKTVFEIDEGSDQAGLHCKTLNGIEKNTKCQEEMVCNPDPLHIFGNIEDFLPDSISRSMIA